MQRTLRAIRSERGSQIVEFALIAPILVYLVFCIPIFSLFARSWIVISGAAREGARAASYHDVQHRQATAVAMAERNLEGLDENNYTIDARVEGNMIVVSVTYNQPTYLPLLQRILNPAAAKRDDTVPLTAVAKFMVE